ncbi:hypothetical protein LTR36_006102 [Oleoguttula mirabilis]|uniref:GIT Spa2 homology (SHD) domain-containing protein n=1 Tax=Oleoguttula mirabilis TaxID=1507867 RepID=A0AAV9JDL8_9PEZI|nr:hypothetical protein LTR36_006102 [Oleoguttula mirabilis]
MNTRPAPPPVSPLSFNSNDSFASRYGNLGAVPTDTPPYAGGPYGVRAQQASLPGSNHPSSGTDMSRPSVSGSSFTRPPSSASSVGRSSDGRAGFGGPPSRDSGRSHMKPDSEEALQRHYHVLKTYLASSLRDEKGNIKPNKARDKLLRLSVTQFMELSTDVYDELLRREDDRMRRVQNVPPSLPPKPTFHPKRNQARQKLSTLPVERFRQLATDVFYELERRIPRFVGTEIDRPISAADSNRAPSRNGMRPPQGAYRGPPPGPGSRPPMGANGMGPPGMGPNGMGPNGMGPNGMGPPHAPYQSFRSASPGMNGPPQSTSPGTRPPTGGSDTSSFGARPLPKTFQSNTIVPNKSTMVEEDDTDEEDNESAFGLDKPRSGISSERFSKSTSSGAGSAEHKEKIRAQEMEIVELREKLEKLEGSVLERDGELEKLEGSVLERDNALEELEASVLGKEHELEGLRATLLEREQELEEARSAGQNREEGLSAERNGWYDLREELEQKHQDAQRLNDDLQRELDQLALTKSQDEQDVRSRHDQELEDLQAQLGSSHRMTIGDLRAQLDNVHDQTGGLHRQLQTHQAENEELRLQLQSAQQSQRSVTNNDHERQVELLHEELANQEKLTNQVRDEAMLYLQEMRDLSRQNDYAIEQEERLAARVTQLEREIETWRHRYAKVKAQNKSLRASTMGLGLQTSFDSGSLIRKEGLLSDGGLVRDVDVTHFQLAIDELLKVARQPSTEPMLDSVKNVVVSVQAIASAVGTDGYPTPSPSPLSPHDGPQRLQQAGDSVAKLKARVTGTANSLITATKQHASAHGLSPVALLDAAASNLTAAVVELIKAVGIRSSPRSELHSDVDEEEHENVNRIGNGIGTHHAAADDDDQEDMMASFYDDRLSAGDRSPAIIAPSYSHSPSPSLQVSSPPSTDTKPAPLNIGRSNTTKKTNGWFGGWGKKSSMDETTAVGDDRGEIEGLESREEPERREGDYDPYR